MSAQPTAHPNALLIHSLFTAIQNADPQAIIACYADDAYFEDIAFRRHGKDRILEMWRLVCHGRPRVTIDVPSISANDREGTGRWMASYVFGKTARKPGRPVDNTLTSRFVFRNGRIVEHRDHSHALAWAVQAVPTPINLLVGWIAPLRRALAAARLRNFLKDRP